MPPTPSASLPSENGDDTSTLLLALLWNPLRLLGERGLCSACFLPPALPNLSAWLDVPCPPSCGRGSNWGEKLGLADCGLLQLPKAVQGLAEVMLPPVWVRPRKVLGRVVRFFALDLTRSGASAALCGGSWTKLLDTQESCAPCWLLSPRSVPAGGCCQPAARAAVHGLVPALPGTCSWTTGKLPAPCPPRLLGHPPGPRPTRGAHGKLCPTSLMSGSVCRDRCRFIA